MGLDQYLWANMTVAPQNYNRETQKFEDNPAFGQVIEVLGVDQEEIEGWFRVSVPVKVWRKSNAIHGWFVRNCQEGVDDCRYASVSQEEIQELLDLIKQCIDTKDASGLPPISGFFFGSKEVDDDYWDDLEDTYVTLRDVVDKYEHFTYSSSW